jgi:hypothetical protein
MKSLPLLLLALSTAVIAHASTAIEELLAPALSGKGTAYFRVALEFRNGMDMRENSMPKKLIQSLEKEGASVRPNRSNTNVGYWIFFKNGDFATCDVVNDPTNANLSYEKLGPYFSDAPHSGQKWSVEGESLVIGSRYYSVRVLPANDPATGGRKGEVEIAIRNSSGRGYYYLGTFVSK